MTAGGPHAEYGLLLAHAPDGEVDGPYPSQAAARDELSRVLRAQPGAVGWVMARAPQAAGWDMWRTVAPPLATATRVCSLVREWASGQHGTIPVDGLHRIAEIDGQVAHSWRALRGRSQYLPVPHT